MTTSASLGDSLKGVELRDQHLLNLLNLARELNETEKAEMIDKLRRQEQRNRSFGVLKYFRGRNTKSQAVNEINIPSSWTSHSDNTVPLEDPKKLYANTPNRNDITNNPDWTTIKTPAEILYYCKMRNQQHFAQA